MTTEDQAEKNAGKVCGDCTHWFAGECYRYPPQLVLWPSDNQPPIIYTPMNGRPSAPATQRACGEFERTWNGAPF